MFNDLSVTVWKSQAPRYAQLVCMHRLSGGFGGSVVWSMNEATSLRQSTKPVEIQDCDLKLFACSCSGGTIIKSIHE